MMRYLSILLVAILGCAIGGGPASAHIRDAKKQWLITGSTYGNKHPRGEPGGPQRKFRADPVNVIWRGPSGATASIGAAIEHTHEHWTERRINDRYPGGKEMKKRTSRVCTTPQLVFMRNGQGKNSGRFQASQGYMTSLGSCLANQWHIRMWNSKVHAEYFGTAHRFEWVLAPLHHDKVRWKCKKYRFGVKKCSLPKHGAPDVPWDAARVIYTKTMKEHCSTPRWQTHKEAKDYKYGDFRSTGLIARISFRHKSEGCGGA